MKEQTICKETVKSDFGMEDIREMYLDESRPVNFNDIHSIRYPAEKCMYCGYEILHGESKAQVIATGDVIHKKCWQDYADENFYELCCVLSHSDGAEDDEETEEDYYS